jgi:hypothetical protein
MLGESVRGMSEAAPNWETVGAATFRPLVATAQDVASGRLLAPREARSGSVMGETVLEGALGSWRNQAGARPLPLLLGSACGVGGRDLAKLLPGAEPALFDRFRACVRTARTAAAAQGWRYRLAAVLFLQGESDVAGFGASDRAAYAGLLHRLIDGACREAASFQPDAPWVLFYQTGGAYAHDAMGVPQAQLDVALGRTRATMAAPDYPYPCNEHGHLDGNGYRWLGQQFGKVLHRILSEGISWRPLHPLAANWDGAAVRVRFHVPVPPLVWGLPFVGFARREIAGRGFGLIDAVGEMPLADVALDGPDAVRLVPARPPVRGVLTVRYADRPRLGRGCLHDSDTTPCSDVFVGHAPGARYAPADAAVLGGRPYSLANWCVGFTTNVSM